MKPAELLAASARQAVPVWIVASGDVADSGGKLPGSAVAWARASGFSGKQGQVCLVPGANNELSAVLMGSGARSTPLDTGKLARTLPAGTYRLAEAPADPHLAALGFLLGAYAFDRYRKDERPAVRLVVPEGASRDAVLREAEAAFLVRDLINTPAGDMGPQALEKAVRSLASRFKARVSVVKGEALLKQRLSMIHAVGRAAAEAPRLIDMQWGNSRHPRLTLVGKGVCFDTGGLDIKPSSGMLLMKKDMGGAANVIGLAMMIMAAKLPVRLRVLIPAVENAISGNAFRPGDVLTGRKGISVEIGNTDAEGRLVLADALALACEEKPQLVIDMATLTGAARVALGPDLPPFYTPDDEIASSLQERAMALHDPLWRLPLWQPYNSMLSSKVADTNNVSSGSFAGSVTAALFLQKFVEPGIPWIHLDVFGWVPTERPWAPVGGEAQGIRALWSLLESRFGGK